MALFSKTNQPPNAGRKPRPQDPLLAAQDKIRDKLPLIVDALIESALGVTVAEVDKEGAVRVYTKPPDVKAATYLYDRVAGKPVQAVEGSIDHSIAVFNVNDFIAAALTAGLRAGVLEVPELPLLAEDVRPSD